MPDTAAPAADVRIEKMRTRWRRWLGQQFSKRQGYGAGLIDPNFSRWPTRVLGRDAEPNEDAADYWRAAIEAATAGNLHRLDMIVLQNK